MVLAQSNYTNTVKYVCIAGSGKPFDSNGLMPPPPNYFMVMYYIVAMFNSLDGETTNLVEPL